VSPSARVAGQTRGTHLRDKVLVILVVRSVARIWIKNQLRIGYILLKNKRVDRLYHKPDQHAIREPSLSFPDANRRGYGKEQRHSVRNSIAKRTLHAGYEPKRDLSKRAPRLKRSGQQNGAAAGPPRD
jgi:hypothetical protein